MKIDKFEWDKNNIWKPQKHNIDPIEVEEIFFNNPKYVYKSHSDRNALMGKTDSGRYLIAFFELKNNIARIITARELTKSELRLFKKRGK